MHALTIAVLSLLVPVHRQTPPQLELSGPDQVPAYRLSEIRATGLGPDAQVLWEWPTADVDAREVGHTLIATGRPGQHTVRATSIEIDWVAKTLRVQRAGITWTIGGATPPPDSPGDPDPIQSEAESTRAIGRIRFGNSGCTATVIHPQRPDGHWDILTAAHCLPGKGAKGVFILDGVQYAVTCTAWEKSTDIAWLRTDNPQAEMPFAYLSPILPKAGEPIWHRSFGVDQPGNRESGKVLSPTFRKGMISMSLRFSSGDSGGGNFLNEANQVVATTFGYINGVPCGGSCVRAWELRPVPIPGAEILIHPIPVDPDDIRVPLPPIGGGH